MGTSKTGRRRAGRSTGRRWRLPSGWGLTLAGLAVIALAAWWITHTSIFGARSIDVQGNRHLDRAAVLRLADVAPGTNLVWFSPGEVQDRLERSPWVLSATVTRALPSSLSISITERSAIAVAVGERDYLVSADRTILGFAGPKAPFPTIDAPPTGVRIGGKLPGPTPGLQVLTAMPASLRSEVEQVGPDRNGLLIVRFKDGVKAIYGDASDAQAKANAVQALLQYADRKGLAPKRLDVRTPEHPALLPVGATPTPAP